MTPYDVSTSREFGPLASVLFVLLEHAGNQHVQVLLIGAAARDVLIRHASGALPERATADVDIAVAVAGWADYSRLTAALVPIGNSGHSFRVEGTEVDVIPFGGVESAGRTITWPSEHIMNTNGFREALACAIVVTLPGGVVIRVASLPAQVVLKLHAWRDRRTTTTRDAPRPNLNGFARVPAACAAAAMDACSLAASATAPLDAAAALDEAALLPTDGPDEPRRRGCQLPRWQRTARLAWSGAGFPQGFGVSAQRAPLSRPSSVQRSSVGLTGRRCARRIRRGLTAL